MHMKRMPTECSMTGRSCHLHDTLATPRLHRLHLETWQPQSPEQRYSISSSQSLQPTAPDLPRKEAACHKCNKPGHWSRECPENKKHGKGRNGNGNERAKDVKSSWKSAPPASGAPQVTKQLSQWKDFQLVCKLQALEHYSCHCDAYWWQERCRWSEWWWYCNQQCLPCLLIHRY